ncbi:MAG: UDP-N-acetylmuramate--alanine ligase [Burkholderiales bacterium]
MTARGRAAPFDSRGVQDRLRIAQVAAKLIAEHGIADWSLAKRKAARQLMLPERAALPGDDEVEAALADYHALFGGEAHDRQLREQRTEALAWMRRLAEFAPLLTGGVAAGWATAHSDIRIELTAADAKLVELALLNAGVAYRAMHADRDGAAELYVDTPRGGVRLSIRAPADARQRPRRDRHGNEELRLDADEVAALVARV